MKYNTKKIKDLIQDCQKNRKMTIPEIGTAVGLSGGMIQKINAGTSLPSIDSLAKMATYFQKDISYFFDQEEETVKNTQLVASPLEIYNPPTELVECYKIMYQQQTEITELNKEIERLKKHCVRDMNADVG